MWKICDKIKEKRRERKKVEVQYVYGMSQEGYVSCEGFVEKLPDLSGQYCDLAVFKRRLSLAEERDNELTYLGEIEV